MHHQLKTLLFTALAITAAWAQQPPQGPIVNSPEVQPDRRITLRILAPKAETVTLMAGDIPGQPRGGAPLTKAENGVWEITLGPVDPGAYRYRFVVNGVPAMDPRNPDTSESNTNAWSLVAVPGNEWMDANKVPHGAVARVHYYSTALGRRRRMTIYTPPGYESGKGKYPVFYLLHGAGDSDDSWTSVGRAGFILDNLIAQKKAVPMIVVMPAGHTSRAFGPGGGMASALKEFTEDFAKDILPYVERNYRVLTGRQHRAIAGLSMGGLQTINVSLAHLDWFSAIGVFSSGVFGAPRPAAPGTPPSVPGPSAEWEKENLAALDNASLKKGLKLLWFATGKEDFLLKTTIATVDMFKKHGFSPVYRETGGGHTWLNWRDYLIEFAPQLFR
jgi:enterochelin esterase family protein